MASAQGTDHVTLDDLRSELRAFAREVLQKDMSDQLKQANTTMLQSIQTFIAQETSDVQRMLVELSQKLSDSSLRRLGDSGTDAPSQVSIDGSPSLGFLQAQVELPGTMESEGADGSSPKVHHAVSNKEGAVVKVQTWTRSPKPQLKAHDNTLAKAGDVARAKSGAITKRKHKSVDYNANDTVGRIGSTSMRMTHHSSRAISAIQSKALDIVTHRYFDYFTAGLILLNGALVGVQIDDMAKNDLEKSLLFFEVSEIVFCVLFTAELSIRLVAYRLAFFTTKSQRGWNIFDFSIVSVQLVELLLNVAASGVGFNFNILRILRLFRIMRLARALRLIGQLRTIVSSIVGSLKPLGWSAVLLFIMIYVVAIIFTQAVHARKVDWNFKDTPPDLDLYWGRLSVSILSLFEAVTGGLDWNDACRPLFDHVGTEIGLFFCAYVLFTVFATLNVVTGVFIDSVMTHATHEKEQHTIQRVLSLFAKLDIDHSGEITWQEFESHLDMKEMRDFFKTIDVNVENARSLFQLLDLDDSGSVNVCDFMDGCLRIWAPARGLDLRMILREVNLVIEMVQGLLHGLAIPMSRKLSDDSQADSSIGSDTGDAPNGEASGVIKCMSRTALNAVFHPEAKNLEDFFGEEDDDDDEDLEPDHLAY